MTKVIDFGYCEEILAWLALHPDGVAVDEVKKHVQDRVRKNKAFDSRFTKSLEKVVGVTPFTIESVAGAEKLIPTSREVRPQADIVLNLSHLRNLEINGAPAAAGPFDFSGFKAIILAVLTEAGTDQPEHILEDAVKTKARLVMTFREESFHGLFITIISGMIFDNPPQVDVKTVAGENIYSIPPNPRN